MIQSGITEEGLMVVADVFPFYGTHGVPLEIILHFFKDRGLVVDWPDYVEGALSDGHKPRTIIARIIAAVGDVYGPDYRNAIETRLNLLPSLH